MEVFKRGNHNVVEKRKKKGQFRVESRMGGGRRMQDKQSGGPGLIQKQRNIPREPWKKKLTG